MSRSFEAFGSSGLRVVWLLSWLEASSPDVPLPPLIVVRDVPAAGDDVRWVEVYEQVSKDFFCMLANHAGSERARRIYETAFQSLSVRFRFLPTFHVVVAMLPSVLLDEEKLSLLDGRQMVDMLRQKVDELEETNRALSDRNGALASSEQKLAVAAEKLEANIEVRTRELRKVVEELRVEVEQRRKVELALRESEERHALAVRGANDGLWDWNLVANQAYYSTRLRAMLGWPTDQPLSDPAIWLKAIHPRDASLAKEQLELHLSGGSSHFESEHRMRHADGNYRWMLVRGVALRDVAGRPYRMAGSQTDIDQRKRVEESIRHEALHDSLTKLPNRTLFFDRLRKAIARSRRHGTRYAVLFLDVDRFKVVNDSLGHAVGDELLVQVARRLRTCVSDPDTLARLGGDEFTVLFEELRSPDAVLEEADRLAVALQLPFDVGPHQIFVTTSAGIALDAPEYALPEDVLRDADTALYRAKEQGRARHVLFEHSMRERAVERLALETSLRRALERNELRLFLQPIVCLKTRAVRQLECLLRWDHPQRGLVGPADFIAIAEETGMIVPIGDWVLAEACRHVLTLRQSGIAHLPHISINLSPVQLAQRDIVARIQKIVADSGVEPSALALEFTESMLMQDPHTVALKLRELRDTGLAIFIDDFGSGYSSFEYLSRFPASALKLDKLFVTRLGSDGDKPEIVRSIIALAHHLGMYVIAEGVEQ
ncbi:MAG TPA: EAL domain-containing protein, partial [Thermoanaerobaculia bacterium]|nr:EAL domain-containing protein [Thermoanaerobaculia bacterium]